MRMNKVKLRARIILLMLLILLLMVVIFIFRWVNHGAEWASSTLNSHIYEGTLLVSGQIVDRNGVVLLSTDSSGQRVYHEDGSVRRATLHAVGDLQGNIAGGAQNYYRDKLAGYSFFDGVYSLRGQGGRLWLSIDAQLNRVAYEALDGRKGCVAVYDYSNGQMVTMVSSPGFDPANAAEAGSGSGEYINRVIGSCFVPGSIFKLVTMAAALENISGIEQRSFVCNGSISYDDGTVNCTAVHGEQDIYDILANSCNCAFAELAQELGGQVLAEYAFDSGMCGSVIVSGQKSAEGCFEIAEQGSADLSWSGIGQYHDMVNPAAVLQLMGAIANDGVGEAPRLIRKVTNNIGLPVQFVSGEAVRLLQKDTAVMLKSMMANNVAENYGKENFPGLNLCAKSGTAEVDGSTPHAWFVGFLDDEQYPLAFVVLVENGGWGSTVAGSVANRVLQAAVNVI